MAINLTKGEIKYPSGDYYYDAFLDGDIYLLEYNKDYFCEYSSLSIYMNRLGNEQKIKIKIKLLFNEQVIIQAEKPIIFKTKSGGNIRLFTFNGETRNMQSWSRLCGITRERMRQRLNKYNVEKAIGFYLQKEA